MLAAPAPAEEEEEEEEEGPRVRSVTEGEERRSVADGVVEAADVEDWICEAA